MAVVGHEEEVPARSCQLSELTTDTADEPRARAGPVGAPQGLGAAPDLGREEERSVDVRQVVRIGGFVASADVADEAGPAPRAVGAPELRAWMVSSISKKRRRPTRVRSSACPWSASPACVSVTGLASAPLAGGAAATSVAATNASAAASVQPNAYGVVASSASPRRCYLSHTLSLSSSIRRYSSGRPNANGARVRQSLWTRSDCFALRLGEDWARLVSNQRPLACEAAVRQARIGVTQKPKCLPDVRRSVGGFDSEDCG